ncbi:MAG: hypothetical protein M1826_004466 [Phylliscum demangeonii]|nr:MAG: hypothetical protein M1826_004466 [Phylliscum demangeonii]
MRFLLYTAAASASIVLSAIARPQPATGAAVLRARSNAAEPGAANDADEEATQHAEQQEKQKESNAFKCLTTDEYQPDRFDVRYRSPAMLLLECLQQCEKGTRKPPVIPPKYHQQMNDMVHDLFLECVEEGVKSRDECRSYAKRGEFAPPENSYFFTRIPQQISRPLRATGHVMHRTGAGLQREASFIFGHAGHPRTGPLVSPKRVPAAVEPLRLLRIER